MQLRKQLGGGSKWLTVLVLSVVIVCLLLIVYLEFYRNPSEKYFTYVIPAAFVFSFFYIHLKKRKASKVPAKLNIVEINRSGVTIKAGDFKAFHPWSAFSGCNESPTLFVLVDKPKLMIYILPKRAFPDENSQNWFRALANEKPANKPSIPAEHESSQPLTGEEVSLELKLRLSDYFDRTLASWLTWGIIIAIFCFYCGTYVYATMTGPANPVVSHAKVFFIFVVPFMLVMMGMVIGIISIKGWLAHRKLLLQQKYIFLENGMREYNSEGFVNVPWNTYACYKETKRSIILWRGRYWLLIPKRAFKSSLEQQNCLGLLRRNLRQSRWFFG